MIARLIAALLLLLTPLAAHAQAPRLVRRGAATQLEVDGRPMLLLAGELGNSSASSAAYMAPHWARLKAMGLNTVLAPVSWELTEPQEGRFDWTGVDALLAGARAHDLRLVLLWFGAWKNSMSTYVPAWVKHDGERFPRARLPNGEGVDILSAFGPATLDADARAFAALMAHLQAVDGQRHTVLMVQVENEIGMLPVARDYGPAASAAFAGAVPAELVAYLSAHRATLAPALKRRWEEHGARTTGTWTEMFGEGDAAAEIFQGWWYARFADRLAAAGKAAYPLPMYVNVALNRPGRAPGAYPSGGPLPHLIDVWKAGAPHLDLLAPDIYFSNFVDLVNTYHRSDNPLLIPEANNADKPEVPTNLLYAFGHADAIGAGPFAIDSVDQTPPAGLAQAFAMLNGLAPAILHAQGTGRMDAFRPRVLYDGTIIYEPQTTVLGGYRLTASFADIATPVATSETPLAGAIVIAQPDGSFLVAGRGVTLTAEPVGDGPPLAGIESAEEGGFDSAGRWVGVRRLNGDQTNQGRLIRLGDAFEIQRVRFYRYR